jgi:hypothetical protein
MHRNDIPRLGHVGRVLDGAERRRARAAIGIIAAGSHVELGGRRGGGKREDNETGGENGFQGDIS